MEKKTTESQLKAIKNWTENNREQSNYLKNRSTARNFIKKKATREDLLELQGLINERLNEN